MRVTERPPYVPLARTPRVGKDRYPFQDHFRPADLLPGQPRPEEFVVRASPLPTVNLDLRAFASVYDRHGAPAVITSDRIGETINTYG